MSRSISPAVFRSTLIPSTIQTRTRTAGIFVRPSLTETKMLEKTECLDSIIFGLNRTAFWRAKMATQYPSDARNARAAECLAELATDTTELSEESWLALQPHYELASERWREAISQIARLVEFKQKIATLPAFVKSLITALAVSA